MENAQQHGSCRRISSNNQDIIQEHWKNEIKTGKTVTVQRDKTAEISNPKAVLIIKCCTRFV